MEIREFHWLMNIVQNLDVGLVVLDREYRIQVWNGFMESHSGRLAGEVRDQGLFSLFPDVDKAWFERKANMVSNLLTVLCSDRPTQPVVNTGTLY